MGMESKVADILGTPVIQAAVVSPRGHGKKVITAGAAGQVAGVAGTLAAAQMTARGRAQMPGGFSGGYMVMALTDYRLAFFMMKRGLLKNGVGDHLETVALAEIASASIGGGLATVPLTITFTDGSSWELEVPRANKGAAEKVVGALQNR